MNYIHITTLSIFLSSAFFYGCKEEESSLLGGEGMLHLQTEINTDIQIVSRSTTVPDEESTALLERAKIRIYQGGRLVRKYSGAGNVPEAIQLASADNYSVRVTSGDSVDVSADKKFYEGITPFVIQKGQTTRVNSNCNLANTLVTVLVGEEFKKRLTGEAIITVGVKKPDGSLASMEYKKEILEEGGERYPTYYYMLPYTDPTLYCSISGTTLTGEKFTAEQKVEKAQKSTFYTLTFDYKEGGGERPDIGGGIISIKADATPLYTQEEEVVILRRPVLKAYEKGVEIPVETPWYLELNSLVTPEVCILATSPIQSVWIESALFQGIIEGAADLMTAETQAKFKEKNIQITVSENRQQLTMQLGDWLNPFLKEEAIHLIHFNVTDTNGKKRDTQWQIIVSNANIKTIAAPVFEIWADKATLYAEVIAGREPQGALSFHYRKKGEETWSELVPATRNESVIKSELIKGLIPGTTYEYQAIEGEKASSVICEFTTETAMQLPNSGFENWSGGIPKLIYGEGEEMFWDSGNHGTEKVKANVTEPDTGLKHSGNSSARMKSMFASMLGIGQFAAGNMFIGQYLDTQMEGLTGHGVIGLGRPFTCRPLALRGYIRYISGKVDKGGGQISNGAQDQGIIYMALTDGDGEAYGNNNWSFIIRTKESKFFNKDAANVIAYGEKVWEQSTEGSAMIPFEIRFNYDEKPDGKTRIPNRLLLVAAASRYGDYFQGSTQSVMWLDDLELIYEESKLSKP